MHTVERLELALTAIKTLGYQVRMDWLGGAGGGGCEIRGQKWLFVDLAQGPADQLDVILSLLAREAGTRPLELPAALQSLVSGRRERAA